MKDLGNAKTIIRWEIIQDPEVRINLPKAEKMSLCYLTILLIKASLTLFFYQAKDHA